MKILHCSDVHLGRRPVGGLGDFSRLRFEDYFLAFEYVIDFAIDHRVDVFLIAGDFFDKRTLSPDILLKAENLLIRLKEKKISVIITEGNHDNITHGDEDDSWIIYLEQKGLVQRPHYTFVDDSYTFYPVEVGGFCFYGAGYSGAFTQETISGLAAHLSTTNTQNIVIIHTAIASEEHVYGTVSADSIREFAGKAIYVAGGHLHSYKAFPLNEPFFFLPGSLEYFDFGEIGQQKGFIVFDTDTKTHSWHNSKCRNATKFVIKYQGESWEDFQVFFENEIQNKEIGQGAIVQCEIHLKNNFNLDLVWCESQIIGKGALKCNFRIISNNNDLFRNNLANYSVDVIEEKIIESWQHFGSQSNLTKDVLQKLKYNQTDNNRDVFLEEFDFLLNSIIDNS